MDRAASETARKGIAGVSHGTTGGEAGSSPVTEDADGVYACEVCGACFETKRGLSSHARSHLRQLGVAVSDSSGAPIDLLYHLIQERDGRLPYPTLAAKSPKPKSPKPKSPTPKCPKPKPPKTKSSSPRKDSGTKLKIKISNLVKKKYSKSSLPVAARPSTTSDASSSSLVVVKPLKAPAKLSKGPVSHPPVSVSSPPPPLSGSPPASISVPCSKPLWAPQETDAPLNLTAMTDASLRDDVHVCELCGAWYETRKGLSSHARAHLRQFGVEMDSKRAPIEVLHELLQRENLQGKASLPDLEEMPAAGGSPPALAPSTAIKPEAPLHADPETPPPPKKPKMSSSSSSSSSSSPPSGGKAKTQGRGDPLKGVSCEFCAEKFKKSQSLASHARSHLRQLGVTEWTVHGSPMATLRQLMARRGSTSLPKPQPPPTMLPPPTATPTTSHSPPTAPPTMAKSSPKAPPPLASTPLTPSSPASVAPRVPKARKGSRMVVSKPKEEPVEVVLSSVESPRPKSTPALLQTWPAPGTSQITPAPKPEVEAAQMVRCEYCSEMFDSRKALSCHARAHLRHLGVKWSPNASPIDTLYELMLREGTYQGSEVKPEVSAGVGGSWKKPSSSPRTFTPSPTDFSIKEKTDSSDTVSTVCEATCELCGFDFENRKALASHARAHLRQQGVDWRTNGSPIDTLSMWMQQEPAKVAELHKRYMQGDLPHVKKRPASSPYPSSDLESSRAGVSRPPTAARPLPGPSPLFKVGGREVKAGASFSSSHRKVSGQRPASLASNAPSRLPRGYERRPPKHLSHTESRTGEAGPLKPPRAGNAPSLMPRPPESCLVKQVGKVYSLKCRFCEEVFKGPLSVQEDWLIHLQQHILNLKQDSVGTPVSQSTPVPSLVLSDTPQLIGPQAV